MRTDRSLVKRAARRARGELRTIQDQLMDRALGISAEAKKYRKLPPDPIDRNNRNETINYAALDQIRERLKLGSDDVFCDVGCGFGRACAYFSRLSISECLGIERDPDIAYRAQANAAAVRNRRAKISILCGDATEQDYSRATAIFLYNPFRGDVLEAVLTRLREQTAGRELKLCYANPVWAETVDRCGWLSLAEDFFVPYAGLRMPVRLYRTAC